jgi:hypothetical protein
MFYDNNRDIYSFIGPAGPFDNSIWVGATDREVEGSFKWIVGNGGNISGPWYPGEPNDADGGQDCANLLRSATFDDHYCYFVKAFVCEKQQ